MFAKIVRDNLLAIAAAYQKATGKGLSTISRDFYGRGDFLAKLRRGEHSLSVAQTDKILGRFRAEWPQNAAWPLTRAIMMDRDPQEKR